MSSRRKDPSLDLNALPPVKRYLIKSIFWIPFSLLAFFGSCALSTMATFPIMDASQKKLVSDDVPGFFPLLAIIHNAKGEPGAHFITWSEREAFAEQYPEHSFRIIKEERRRLHELVRMLSDKDDIWEASFKVRDLRGGIQSIEVSFRGDDDDVNTGYYKVVEEKVIPTHHKAYFGPGMAILMMLPAMVITLILFPLALHFGRRWEKRFFGS